MKGFTENFQTQLWQTIAAIEERSLIEIVVVIKPRSESYRETSVIWGIIAAFIMFTFMMFSPAVVGDYLLYVAPIIAFSCGMLLSSQIPWLQRILTSRQRRQRSVEIMARALFQKGGLQHTQEKIGTLIYCSLLEREVCVLPDRGAETAIPAVEWDKMRQGLRAMFQQSNPADALLQQLQAFQPVCAQYLPPIEHDMNELPDNLNIEL